MSDGIPLSKEEADEILEWSLRAAALFVLMHEFANLEGNTLESQFEQPIEYMFHNMPEVMHDQAIALAQEAHDEAVADAEKVAQFQDELDALPEIDEPERPDGPA